MKDLEFEIIKDAAIQRPAQCFFGPIWPWREYSQDVIAIICRLVKSVADGRFVQEAQKCGCENVLTMREVPAEVS